MTAYAVGRLRDVRMGPDIVQYLQRIDATLAAFGGRFVIHGGEKLVLEGEWRDDLIVIAFADLERARAWYASPDYQQIVPLRTRHAAGDVIIVEGVGADHRATDILDPAGRTLRRHDDEPITLASGPGAS